MNKTVLAAVAVVMAGIAVPVVAAPAEKSAFDRAIERAPKEARETSAKSEGRLETRDKPNGERETRVRIDRDKTVGGDFKSDPKTKETRGSVNIGFEF